MATRSGLRSRVRRLLKEDTADNWTDVELDNLLNLGLQDMQEFVMDIDNEAFMRWDTTNLVVDQRYYPKPTAIFSEVELGYSADPTVNAYLPLHRKDFHEIRQYESQVSRGTDITIAGQGSIITNDYSTVGRYWYLGWSPDTAVTDGLQAIYIPALTMAADADVPDLHINLHDGIALSAAIKALDEVSEVTENLEKRLAIMVGKISMYHRASCKSFVH